MVNLITRNIPSDGSGLADKVRKFAVSRVRQQHAKTRSHHANCAKNDKWQNFDVNTCQHNKTHSIKLAPIGFLHHCQQATLRLLDGH